MEDKHALEIRLLQAQITNLESQNKKGLLREALPSLWAIAFSIVASIVVIMIGEYVVNTSMTELNKIESELKLKNEELANIATRYEKLNELYSSVVGKTMLYDLGVDFNITIEKEGNVHVVHATSNTPNVKFRSYDMCKNSFVFPGGVPNTSLCHETEGHCSQENTKQHCTFPLLIFGGEEGIFLSAEVNSKTVFRYVHIPTL